jgi:Kef-type K+ transport system membrane component KefB
MSAEIVFHVLLALAVVVIAGQLLGRVVATMGQPPVIGEVLSGILLGPSLLGLVSPAAQTYLFPDAVRPALGVVAHVGVLLYMFLVGLEFDTGLLKQRAAPLIVTSQASIIVPFLLGCALAAAMYEAYAPDGVSRLVFALFMGVAMSITAFPVLARILTDRGLTQTELGVASLTCAAINDVMAWCLLALVVGTTRAMPSGGVPGELVIAFALGVIVPHRSPFALSAIRGLHGIVTILLLPAFFALTGLRTHIGLVSTPYEWAACALIILVATVGKFGGAAFAGRLMGMSWRFAGRLGALMNTRGLMELVVLNVGLDAGLIDPTLFTMMVIMALVTTAMTTPLLDLIGGAEDRRKQQEHAEGRTDTGRHGDTDRPPR